MLLFWEEVNVEIVVVCQDVYSPMGGRVQRRKRLSVIQGRVVSGISMASSRGTW